MSENPYASPATIARVFDDRKSDDEPLAGRFTRLIAVVLDGVIMMTISVPIQVTTGYWQRAMNGQVGMLEQFAMSLLSIVIMLALNGYLLAKRGQTIGKLVTKIQIVDYTTGELLPFVRVYVLRYLWMLPLAVLCLLVPGVVDDYLLGIISIANILFIFRADRRCLHDLIAGSKVVLYDEDRKRLHAA